ncbi:DAK2 domain-containing protein [Glycomyces buryatensis]|uniref:DAK2 domain-containing protein n=1 Tax=Glycomyces buryatensis TaxID=2570927 RepID=UPI0014562F33|nr:DAK2 domain-containing protein [Glycomyces buryatensis]
MSDIPEHGRQVLDADAMRQWAARGIETLTRHRRGVDELNVFPVADSDTATNMLATLQAAFQGATPGLTLPALMDEAASRALLAARGNSGVILAQMLRGLADAWTAAGIDSRGFAAGLRSATDAATAAVAVPTAGTILTVAETAASAAAKAAPFGLVSAARAAAEAAADAVAATPGQLPALARAGVVDAGGMALALLLEALVETLTGSVSTGALDLLERHRNRSGAQVEEVPRETGSEAFDYEVQYLLESDAERASELRHRLIELGDSVVIIGSRAAKSVTTFNVHVHVNDIGAAIEAGIERGRVHRISVTRFDDAYSRHHGGPASGHEEAGPFTLQRAVAAVTSLPQLRGLLESEGCPVAATASPDDVLAAIRAGGGPNAVVLVDDPAALDAVREAVGAARRDGYRVAVIPTGSIMQSLAAFAVHDAERPFDDDVIAMAEAAASCRTGEVRFDGGTVLGLVDGDVIHTGTDPAVAALDLVDRLCSAGAELVTVLAGSGSDAETVTALSDHVRRAWPLVELQQLPAGQDEPLILIGAE